MTQPAQLAVLALEQVTTVLGRLTAEQLVDLAEGRGQLVFQGGDTLVRADGPAARPSPADSAAGGAGTDTTPGAEVDVEATAAEISALSSRDEVAGYLQTHDRRLTAPVLREVARQLGPTVAAGRTKTDLKRNIIEGTAGFRERSAAMSGGAWS